MQKNYLYEYAIIRVVPKVEREEFINVGIILFSKEAKYIKTIYRLNVKRFRSFTSELTEEAVMDSLTAFEKICNGWLNGGLIAQLDIAERFRWLTAVRSASIQTSRPHPGFSDDLDLTLERLFNELVV